MATTEATLEIAERLLEHGDAVAARRELDAVAAIAGNAAPKAEGVAQLYMRLGEAQLAADFYARAVALEPARVAYRYNQSTALIALGRMEAAEAALDDVIRMQPQDYDAWYNRATLRRQTPERNHVAAIEQALQQPGLPQAGAVPLGYALAKELEDLGAYARSFAALARAAAARRAQLSYRVEDDIAIMQAIAGAHTAAWARAPAPGCEDARPIFVVGLPRSGTTLVDRILSSHSGIGSHGESADFALELMRLAGHCRDKGELLDRSLHLDPRELGSAYCRRLAACRGARVVDKTPANFLYLGLIARALPKARIIYVRRQPLDVCYAMYKTLFRMAYPYSYDLRDLGRYWLAFAELMRHWQAALPAGRMLIVDYETLVTHPTDTIRRLLGHVDMPWQDACLGFERNPLPSLSASAAQVRQPMYTSSVGAWRRYADGLAPLVRMLRAAGVDVDAGVPA